MSQNPLPNVSHVIAVASGKGGVGKSTVAANLACALAAQGHKVGLLDSDIYGPSQHIMFGLSQMNPMMSKEGKIIPFHRHGVFVMSFGFFVKPNEAVIWRGPMIGRMFQQLISDVTWGTLDYLVLDLPPGTGDIQLTLSQMLQLSGAVIVTTPQDVALADAIKGVQMFKKVNVEILGLVENMSYYACTNCGHEAHIFSSGGGKKRAEELGVPLLAEIPLEIETRAAGDEGKPIVVAKPDSPQAKRFLEIASKVNVACAQITHAAPQISVLKQDQPFDV